MDELTIDNVFRSVILATLKSSNNSTLRTSYDQILDDLDNDKDLTSKQSVLANFDAPRRDTRINLTVTTPRTLRHSPRRSKPSSTTSTSDKVATN
jgi:hypothetical protein